MSSSSVRCPLEREALPSPASLAGRGVFTSSTPPASSSISISGRSTYWQSVTRSRVRQPLQPPLALLHILVLVPGLLPVLVLVFEGLRVDNVLSPLLDRGLNHSHLESIDIDQILTVADFTDNIGSALHISEALPAEIIHSFNCSERIIHRLPRCTKKEQRYALQNLTSIQSQSYNCICALDWPASTSCAPFPKWLALLRHGQVSSPSLDCRFHPP